MTETVSVSGSCRVHVCPVSLQSEAPPAAEDVGQTTWKVTGPMPPHCARNWSSGMRWSSPRGRLAGGSSGGAADGMTCGGGAATGGGCKSTMGGGPGWAGGTPIGGNLEMQNKIFAMNIPLQDL